MQNTVKTRIYYLIMWETQTRDGYTSRHYSRTRDTYQEANALYLSKSRDQYPRLFKVEETEIRPAYRDENGFYHANFTHDVFILLRSHGE